MSMNNNGEKNRRKDPKNIQVQNIPVVEIFVNKTLPWVKWMLDITRFW